MSLMNSNDIDIYHRNERPVDAINYWMHIWDGMMHRNVGKGGDGKSSCHPKQEQLLLIKAVPSEGISFTITIKSQINLNKRVETSFQHRGFIKNRNILIALDKSLSIFLIFHIFTIIFLPISETLEFIKNFYPFEIFR